MAVERTIQASRRRVLFGVNVLIQALLALALVVGIVWLASRATSLWSLRGDWTSIGINSLSPRTAQLLRGLNQDVRITALFAEPNREREPVAAKRYEELQDLLALYDSAGGAHVSTHIVDPVADKGKTEQLLQNLRKLPAYANESQTHQAALDEFPALNEQIKQLVTQEGQTAEQMLQSNPALADNRIFRILLSNWRGLAQKCDDVAETLVEQSGPNAEIPRYGQAINTVREFVDEVRTILRESANWMEGEGTKVPGLAPQDITAFQGAGQRFADVLAAIDALYERIKDLKEVKLEEVYNNLTRWRSGPPVLVESANEARVVSNYDLWTPPSDPNAPPGPGGDDRVFAGEAAISSAILQLTQQDKTAVIFTHFGGKSPIRPDFSQLDAMDMRRMPTAPYQELAQRLEKENFATEDWDVAKEKTPPTAEGASRNIYVVFPPEPPPPPNPMQRTPPPAGITPEDRKIITDAVEASGMGIFLAGWMEPTQPMPGAVGTYEFAGYLKATWNVDVDFTRLVWQFMANVQKGSGWWAPQREPMIATGGGGGVRLTDHPIAAPSRNDRAGFPMACPIRTGGATQPADLKVETIAEVPPTQDVWAVADPIQMLEQFKANQGVRPAETDLRAPFPIAVSATNSATGKKIIVIGSERFASDQLAQAAGLMQVGNSYVLGALFPANTDLFINALHWLTGESNRIAVGPRADVPRLTKLNENWARLIPVLLVGVWPALAVCIGLGVWLVRRR